MFKTLFNSFIGFVAVLVGIIVILYALIFQGNNIWAIVIGSVIGFFIIMWGSSHILKQFFKTGRLSPLTGTTPDLQKIIEANNETLNTNYDTLRNQTSISFVISNILFVLGFLIICASLFLVFPSAKSGTSNQEGVKELGVFAGIMTEFISGTAMVIYRDCLTNLNKVSERLEENQRFFLAYRFIKDLGLDKDKNSEGILKLITAFAVRSPIK
jgi:cadmium resistance protein CadD (predicted permease)